MAFWFRRKSEKNRFSRWQPWWPSWSSFQNDFSYFDLLVIPILSITFPDNWPFGLGDEAKNRFPRWPPSRISNRSNFSYFLSTSYTNASYRVSSQLAFRFWRRSEKYIFQMAAILDFPDTFDLQVTPMLPTVFQVNWPFGSGEEAKNIFSRWPPRPPSWITDRNDFSYILIYKSPQCFLPSFKSIDLFQ